MRVKEKNIGSNAHQQSSFHEFSWAPFSNESKNKRVGFLGSGLVKWVGLLRVISDHQNNSR